MDAMWSIGEVAINGDVPENVGCGVQCWWCGWRRHTMRQWRGFGSLLGLWFGRWWIGLYAFSVEWTIVVKRVLHFIWIGDHQFVAASLADLKPCVRNFVSIVLWFETILLLLFFCEDVAEVDCCEGGGLYNYKGIMIILVVVKCFQVHTDGWSFQRGFIVYFAIEITGGRRHQEGCQSWKQPHMMPCSCKCGCIGGWYRSSLWKRAVRQGCRMDLRAQRIIP